LDNIKPFTNEDTLLTTKPSEFINWSAETSSTFSEKTLGKIVSLTFKSKSNNIYNVDMYLKNQNVADLLIEQGLCLPEYESTVPLSPEVLKHKQNHQVDSPRVELYTSRFIKPAKIPLSELVEHEIEVTCIYSPYCFYVQLCKDQPGFKQFEQTLQDYYANESQLSDLIVLRKPRIGQMFVSF
jgi:hypothetical protein